MAGKPNGPTNTDMLFEGCWFQDERWYIVEFKGGTVRIEKRGKPDTWIKRARAVQGWLDAKQRRDDAGQS